MVDILAYAALSLSGPTEGMCYKYSTSGDMPCVSWSTPSAVYIHDGHNTMRYRHVYGNVFEEYINGVAQGHKLCTYRQQNLSCFLGVKFYSNED